jgi:site-specific recombinase XerD
MAVLTDLPKVVGNPYVIAGQKSGSHMVNLKRAWEAVRAKATVDIWKAHEDQTVTRLISDLEQKLEREPSIEECQEAAKAIGINLPSGLMDVRRHDLRHAFASVAASSGMGLPIIGKMLGHSQSQTTQRYAHLANDPVKAAAASVANKIAAAMDGERTSASISDISKVRA